MIKKDPSLWKYVRVCYPTVAKNPFAAPYGKRKSVPVAEFFSELKASHLSLVIPCWTENPVPSSVDAQLKSCPWLKTYVHPRYFGLVDFDADMSAVRNGSRPVFEGLPLQDYSSSDQVKIDFANKLLAEGQGSYRWALEKNAEFDKIYQLTKKTSAVMSEAQIPHFAYYTGGCGFRILFEDKRLFLNVGWFENYSTKFMEEIWPKYLKEVLAASPKLASEIVANTDKSIYDRDKGVKPDLANHFVTRLWPVAIEQFEEKVAKNSPDESLNERIVNFWQWVFQNIPEEMPFYSAPRSAAIQKLLHRVDLSGKE